MGFTRPLEVIIGRLLESFVADFEFLPSAARNAIKLPSLIPSPFPCGDKFHCCSHQLLLFTYMPEAFEQFVCLDLLVKCRSEFALSIRACNHRPHHIIVKPHPPAAHPVQSTPFPLMLAVVEEAVKFSGWSHRRRCCMYP